MPFIICSMVKPQEATIFDELPTEYLDIVPSHTNNHAPSQAFAFHPKTPLPTNAGIWTATVLTNLVSLLSTPVPEVTPD